MQRLEHKVEGSESLSERVVTAVADELGADPTDLEPLFVAIDPDALDSLFGLMTDGTPRISGQLSFWWEGCEVTVDAAGDIDVKAHGNGVTLPNTDPVSLD